MLSKFKNFIKKKLSSVSCQHINKKSTYYSAPPTSGWNEFKCKDCGYSWKVGWDKNKQVLHEKIKAAQTK